LFSLIPGLDEKADKRMRRVDRKPGVPGLKLIGTAAATVCGASVRAQRADAIDDRIQA
jgi:hypothetical protein